MNSIYPLFTHHPLTALWNYVTGSTPEKNLAKKVSDLFKSNEQLAIQHQERSEKRMGERGRTIGNLSSVLLTTTGVSPGLHEIVGHGLLGFKTVLDYSASGAEPPHYWLKGWDNFQKMGHAQSFSERLTAFFNWICLDYVNYAIKNDITSSQTVAGIAFYGKPSGYTTIGKALGVRGSNAWISLAGVIPGLALDWASIASGMFIRKRHPLLGSALVSFGLTDGAFPSLYALEAAVKSNRQKMHAAASQGHDFANAAVQLGDITGISPQMIAICVASIITAIGPLIALFSYLHTAKSKNPAESAPDLLALKHWANKATTNEPDAACLKKLCDLYSRKKGWKTIEKVFDQKSDKKEVVDFLIFLLNNMPNKILIQSKKEIFDAKQMDNSPHRLQRIFQTCKMDKSRWISSRV